MRRHLTANTRRTFRLPAVLIALLVLAGTLAAFPPSAGAAAFVVENCNDAGTGSLRQAILNANAAPSPPHTINFNLDSVCDTITLLAGQLTLAQSMTIQGPGAAALTVSGNNASRVFAVSAGVTATISGLTIADGTINGHGGGVHNAGTLTILDSAIRDNETTASNASGGGVAHISPGTLTITNTTISDNIAGNAAGGVYNFGGTVNIDTGSVISGNTAAFTGGGVRNDNLGTVNLTNSTISGNTATAQSGGGVYNSNSSAFTATSSTISGNTATNSHGGGVTNVGTFNLIDSTINGNNTPVWFGGGVHNSGTFNVTNSTIGGNTSGGFGGGVINSAGSLIVVNSTFSGNTSAGSFGGAIYNSFGAMAISGSTINGNTSSGYGGGVFTHSNVTVTITNSTISGNTASSAFGGGVYNSSGALVITSSTISENRALASTDGGGVHNTTFGTLTLSATIVAGNESAATPGTHPDLSGTFIDGHYNLIGDGTGSTGLTHGDNGNIVGTSASPVNPLLGPLQDNAGPTETHALLTGSPAIDHIPHDAGCAAGEDTDQRGVARPVGPRCDIGAFEGVVAGGPDPEPTRLAFITAPHTGAVNDCLGPITVQTQDDSDISTNVTSDTTVNLATDGGGSGAGTFFSDSGCTASITSSEIPTGSDATTFYYMATSRGSGAHLLTATATDLAEAQQTQTIDVVKEPAGITLSDLIHIYDGTPKETMATTDPPGLDVDITYDGSPTPPTNAGSYAVEATIDDDAFEGSETGTLVINRATGSVSINNIPSNPLVGDSFTPTYDALGDGSPSTASLTPLTCEVVGNDVTFIAAGECQLQASITEGMNHEAATGPEQSVMVAAVTIQAGMLQTCLYSGSLSQVQEVPDSGPVAKNCGRGEQIIFHQGDDYTACLYAGSLSQVGYAPSLNCGRGYQIGMAAGTNMWACLYAGSLSQVGFSLPSSCGRGAPVGFSRPLER